MSPRGDRCRVGTAAVAPAACTGRPARLQSPWEKRAKRYLARATPEFITCMMTLCRRAGAAVRRPPARMMNDRENGARWRSNNRGQQPRDRTFTTPPPEHLSPPGITRVIVCPLGLGFWLAFVVRIGLSGTKLG